MSDTMSMEMDEEENMQSKTKKTNGKKPQKKTTKRKRKVKKWSKVWLDFDELDLLEGETEEDVKAQCKHCDRRFLCHSHIHGINNLKRHLLKCEAYIAKQSKGQTQIMFEHGDEKKMMAWKFDQKENKKALAHMIIVDELPFSFVERDGFRHYSRISQPLFDVPCRGTSTTDCYKLYDEEKIKLVDVIRKNIGRICLTTDSWTSSVGKKSYMALTGHFIDNEWKLKKKVLNFCRLDGHSGVDIGKGVESCVNEWGINAILAISVDNASANDRLRECSNPDATTTNPPTTNRLRDKMKASSTSTATLSELSKYLDESVEAFDSNMKFDILAWWKVNSPRFPIVSLMARDLLAIPVSTVASESVFSTSGRVLDSFRSSLSDKSIESLICTQDWLRKAKDKIPEEEEDCETIITDSSEDEGPSTKKNVNGNESFIIED